MTHLYYIALDLFEAAVVFVPVIIVSQFTLFRQNSFTKKLLVITFAAYLTGVFCATGIPSIRTIRFDPDVNLIPIVDIVNDPVSYIKNTILNIILFIPLGFLLPIIWKTFRPLKKVIAVGLGLSVLIELLQLFNFRLTDIDDLITNTVGTLIGFLMAKLAPKCKSEYNYDIYEPFIIFAIALLTMFFAQPFISTACSLLLFP